LPPASDFRQATLADLPTLGRESCTGLQTQKPILANLSMTPPRNIPLGHSAGRDFPSPANRENDPLKPKPEQLEKRRFEDGRGTNSWGLPGDFEGHIRAYSGNQEGVIYSL
jgi:hypothetical protein